MEVVVHSLGISSFCVDFYVSICPRVRRDDKLQNQTLEDPTGYRQPFTEASPLVNRWRNGVV